MSERKILNISLPEELYCAVRDMADAENKTKAELTWEIIREYITKRERWVMIRKWGKQTADDMGITGEDILDDIIHNSRQAT